MKVVSVGFEVRHASALVHVSLIAKPAGSPRIKYSKKIRLRLGVPCAKSGGVSWLLLRHTGLAVSSVYPKRFLTYLRTLNTITTSNKQAL